MLAGIGLGTWGLGLGTWDRDLGRTRDLRFSSPKPQAPALRIRNAERTACSVPPARRRWRACRCSGRSRSGRRVRELGHVEFRRVGDVKHVPAEAETVVGNAEPERLAQAEVDVEVAVAAEWIYAPLARPAAGGGRSSSRRSRRPMEDVRLDPAGLGRRPARLAPGEADDLVISGLSPRALTVLVPTFPVAPVTTTFIFLLAFPWVWGAELARREREPLPWASRHFYPQGPAQNAPRSGPNRLPGCHWGSSRNTASE